MATLGERIKQIRKEQGLTLQALAGDELSKGMLSLIENNKANPSMESLSYIAERLGIDRTELLQEMPTAELRALLDEIEEKHRNIAGTGDKMIAEYEEIVERIHPYVDKLPFRYESARLLEIYSRCCYHTKRFDWKPAFDRAQTIYEQLHLINSVADLHMFRALMKLSERRYEEALETLQASRKMFEEQTGILDPLKKLDFDYYESILYSATGDKVNAHRLMEEAITYSKKHQIFYQINALYRLAGFEALLAGDLELKNYYIGKLRLFAEFSEDEDISAYANAIEIHYFNSFTHEYEKADHLLEENRKQMGMDDYYYLEKGKALYGMKHYAEALDCFKQHHMNPFMPHPYDLSMHYEKEAYMALIYEQLGEHEQAKIYAQQAKELIEPMPDLPYKQFILETHRKIFGKAD
ncbi:helix-turn-helix domain-containing protein [Planococcus sp. CP5-4]|uniref:helix-turn-helix domain-containing protein n=1 Tax=unclassified Planococcus (in: firmicutes) TaxID=2662419 RepID=UPI001C22794A|nr:MULTISPECIES: helix-turn-helix transcriptional regulator [unclassified Planococcus (in: firmicutes)]MBU9672297.1 helix-turn-helix domain-containing protein [Planococcus sp. CP5-4_YE]MBV0909348.1 helix-turn-helix domain-containing protein [Planococcus sp. CP5-4_UN]MBW6064077.1 helix-turn-helix domain-containing protein [Planococcus sp. CP5-4]